MLEHGLSSGVEFPTDRTVGPGRGVLLLEVTIQSLDQGILLITEVTPPWLVLVAFKLLRNVTEDGDYT